jgi:hypothetical protein
MRRRVIHIYSFMFIWGAQIAFGTTRSELPVLGLPNEGYHSARESVQIPEHPCDAPISMQRSSQPRSELPVLGLPNEGARARVRVQISEHQCDAPTTSAPATADDSRIQTPGRNNKLSKAGGRKIAESCRDLRCFQDIKRMSESSPLLSDFSRLFCQTPD